MPSKPSSRHTKSTQGAGTPSQPKERGHQVNPLKKGGGVTKSIHRGKEGTPSQPTEKSQGVSTDRLKEVH